jgi:malate synthase
MSQPNNTTGPINDKFYDFINEAVLPLVTLNETAFWQKLTTLLNDFSPYNQQLLQLHNDMPMPKPLQSSDFVITTDNVDEEVTTLSGPQMTVPLKNARFALNATNARWGSLYDVLYGTDAIPQTAGLKTSKKYNQARGNHVISFAKDFLDETFPLDKGSHHDVTSYLVYYQHLLAMFPDGSTQGLNNPGQFVALSGHKSDPTDIVLKNNGLHVVIEINRAGSNGQTDLAGIEDIQIEAALTTLMDFEASNEPDDKLEVYRHWLGLMQGNLEAHFDKDGNTVNRQMNKDKRFTCKEGNDYCLHGRTLLVARNAGLQMDSQLMRDSKGNSVPQGILDTVVTALVGSLDKGTNSQTGSIYIVKPQIRGPEEVKFTDKLFSGIEDMLDLPRNTLKLVLMEEKQLGSANLKECIRMAKDRVVFINAGCVERTADKVVSKMAHVAAMPSPSAAVLDVLHYHKFEGVAA